MKNSRNIPRAAIFNTISQKTTLAELELYHSSTFLNLKKNMIISCLDFRGIVTFQNETDGYDNYIFRFQKLCYEYLVHKLLARNIAQIYGK